MPRIQRYFLISGLYYNDIKLPVGEFPIEANNAFVIKRVDNFTVISIIDRSWESEKVAEESMKESHAKLLTYLGICAAILPIKPRVMLSSTPSNSNETYALDDLIKKGKSLCLGYSTQGKNDDPFVTKTISKEMFRAKRITEQSKEDKKNFKRFLNKTRTLYQTYFPFVLKSKSLLTATEYFVKTVSSGKSDYHVFIDAMISLEALFNDGGDSISYKIRMRAGALLGLSDFKGDLVFADLKKLYDKRNEIVHGNANTGGRNQEFWDVMEIHDKIEIYVKTCLTYFYILAKNRNTEKDIKKTIIHDLDRSLLDKDLRVSMEREISNGLKHFKFIPLTKYLILDSE